MSEQPKYEPPFIIPPDKITDEQKAKLEASLKSLHERPFRKIEVIEEGMTYISKDDWRVEGSEANLAAEKALKGFAFWTATSLFLAASSLIQFVRSFFFHDGWPEIGMYTFGASAVLAWIRADVLYKRLNSIAEDQ